MASELMSARKSDKLRRELSPEQAAAAAMVADAQARKYLTALMSDLPRKNGWTIGEHAGDTTPDPTQRLLNHAVWDHDQALKLVRGFVVEHLADQPLVVAALDESGQEKTGDATV